MVPSLEEFEAHADAMVTRFEYRTDSAGAGAFRGGLGTDTVIRFPPDSDERLFACTAGLTHPPPGLAGGGVGASAAIQVASDEHVTDIAKLAADGRLDGGTELRILTPGGAGWGDPRDRSPEHVRADILAGYVTAAAARATYGVDEGGDAS